MEISYVPSTCPIRLKTSHTYTANVDSVFEPIANEGLIIAG